MMNRLLLPTDFSEISKNALQFSHSFAQALSADLTVMHACESRLNRFWLPRKKHDSIMHQLEDFIRDGDGVIPDDIHLMIRRGKLEEVVNSVCTAGQFRYVVIGKKHAYSAFPKINGTKTSRLFARAHCPVLVVPSKAGYEGIQNILIVGGHHRSMNPYVQENILSLSLRFGANLHYLQFSEDPISWEFKQEILNKKNLLVQKSMPEDIAPEGILEYVQDNKIDLLVMMRNRQKTFEDLFNFGAEKRCLADIDLPLLVFHNNFLQMRLDKDGVKAVGQSAVAI
jgi:nucleotide-binding universal stress UspA family protein